MSQASIEVRPADLRDPTQESAYLRMLDAYAEDPMGGGAPLAEAVRKQVVPGLLSHPTTRVWLAWNGAEPVGMLVGFVGFSTFRAKPLLNVHDLAVISEYRGQQIGETLLAAAEAHARENGFCKMTLETQAVNTRARALYKRFGFGNFAPGADAHETIFLEKSLTAP